MKGAAFSIEAFDLGDMMDIYSELIKRFEEADMVAIGLGSELAMKCFADDSSRLELLDFYNRILDKRNYFIVTTHKNNIFEGSAFNTRRIANPFVSGESEKQWDLYNKWLSATLNKKLLLIELGEGFNQPNVFRFPFERVTMINRKAYLYRVNGVFYQLPAELGERASSVECNALEYIAGLKKFLEQSEK